MDHNSLHIIKIGGKVINDPDLLTSFLQELAQMTEPTILVHGGGRKATEVAQDLGIKTQMIEGRRITDDAMLEVVTMIYAGLINKQIVAKLAQFGTPAIGMSGADGNSLLAHQREHPSIDFGWVGDIDQVNTAFLSTLLSKGLTPVICPITHDGKGQLLNTNADTIAAELAIAFAGSKKVTLKYCFEFSGVLKDLNHAEVYPEISHTLLQELKDHQIIHNGMIPKLDNAFRAKRIGVDRVSICGIENLTSEEGLTWIV